MSSIGAPRRCGAVLPNPTVGALASGAVQETSGVRSSSPRSVAALWLTALPSLFATGGQ
jgi:hypothetical protein